MEKLTWAEAAQRPGYYELWYNGSSKEHVKHHNYFAVFPRGALGWCVLSRITGDEVEASKWYGTSDCWRYVPRSAPTKWTHNLDKDTVALLPGAFGSKRLLLLEKRT